jgi:histidinol dehydrogenase
MAYGTGSIPAVDKIFGPGNPYVTLAKQLVSLDGVAIDMPAGPSEVAVIADESADPAFIASDLIAQAEHGTDSQVLLVTSDVGLADPVKQEISRQLEDLPRKDIATKAMEKSRIIILENQDEVIDLVNMYAPEHLIIMCRDYGEAGIRIKNAGSVFMGEFTPESAGDYASGTNHTLPTGGYARAYSGLGLLDFQKRISFQEISEEGLADLGPAIIRMAEEEELEGHANAVKVRLSKATDNLL